MKIFCSHQKRCSVYTKLRAELSSQHISPDEVLRICKSERIPPVEEQIIKRAIDSGHCTDGLRFAQQIAHHSYEIRKNIFIHIVGLVIFLTLSASVTLSYIAPH